MIRSASQAFRPQRFAEINARNPLTASLLTLVVGNYDYVSEQALTSVGGSAIWTTMGSNYPPCAGGFGLDATSTSYWNLDIPTKYQLTTSAYTLAIISGCRTSSITQKRAVSFRDAGGTVTIWMSFGNGAATDVYSGYRDTGAGFPGCNLPVPTTNQLVTATVTKTAGTIGVDTVTYRNGGLVAPNSPAGGTSATLSGYPVSLQIGNVVAGTLPFGGTVPMVALFNRPLLAYEQLSWHANPWQLLLAPQRRVWAKAASVSAAFRPRQLLTLGVGA